MTELPDSPFLRWLINQSHGSTLADLDTEFSELIEDITVLGKSGDLTLKVRVGPATKTQAGTLTVSATVKTTRPKPLPAEQVWFADPATGGLADRDPRQPRLPNFNS